MSDSETLFSVKDPRGYTVSLSKERYDSHIIGESGHIDVPHKDIRSAVEKPYVIYNSARFEGRQLYFAKCSSVHPPLYVKVAAEMNETQKTGEVVTASRMTASLARSFMIFKSAVVTTLSRWPICRSRWTVR